MTGNRLPVELRKLKRRTGWSWEKMNREFALVMGEDGPCHTTLFRIASGRNKAQATIAFWIHQAMEKLAFEEMQEIIQTSGRAYRGKDRII